MTLGIDREKTLQKASAEIDRQIKELKCHQATIQEDSAQLELDKKKRDLENMKNEEAANLVAAKIL